MAIAKKDRTCTRCQVTIPMGASYTLYSTTPIRICESCEREGKCEYSRGMRGMADIGQDLRCMNPATGTTAENKRCCGYHSDAARVRGAKLTEK